MADLFLLFTYVLTTTFSPGPNNITAMAAGTERTYRQTLPYLLGIWFGFILVMVAAGLLNSYFTDNFKAMVNVIRWFGFFYLIWLAVSLFLSQSLYKVCSLDRFLR